MKYNNPNEKLDIKYNRAVNFFGKLVEYVDDVDAILRDVARHYDADRAYIFELSEDGKTLDNTYEYCKEGVTPEIDNLQNVPFESVEVWFEEFERVGAFFISSLDKDVEASSLTYEILEPQGIESLITAPLYNNDKIIGLIGVDNPRENTDDIVILNATASILYSEMRREIARKNAELGEIKDIVAAANMGIWRIVLVENEEPKMYANDTMRMLLGIEDLDITPEKIYSDWFDNIVPEAVPSVLGSVKLMQEGCFDENTYLWKHPTKGVRYVRCGGTAKPIPGGFSIQGYHYDVDEVVRKDQAQMLSLKKAMDDKKEYYDTLGALGDIFYSMHVIDLEKDTVVEFSARNQVKEIVNQKEGATLMMNQVISTVTSEEYLETALEFTDLSTVSDRMKNSIIMSAEFLGKNIGWYAASFIVMNKDEAGRPTKVIFTSRVIDTEKKQKESLIKKTQTDEMTGLLNRRAYEEDIYEHNDIPSQDKFVYISLDANGLKVVNDTLGHTAGDELLIGVSECMKKCFGPYGKLYRIGGDEFVAILFCDESKMKSVKTDFDSAVKNWKGSIIDEISVSYGWASKSELPNAKVRQLGMIAEQRMYADKAAYYSKKGVDRTGQQEAHKALCSLYTKILKINITDDSYQIINMDEAEKTIEKGFASKISEWFSSFGMAGQVHPDDLAEYLKKTDLNYLKECFSESNEPIHIVYRRMSKVGFRRHMMELVPANDYTKDNKTLFLYVKCIE